MQKSIASGLKKEGVLHGGLKLSRKARDFIVKTRRLKDIETRTGLLSGYALAVSEENASIPGAIVGCQGEVGVACAMAAGAATQLMGGSSLQFELRLRLPCYLFWGGY